MGSLEGGAEAGCWDGAPMLSPIRYLSDNLHIFISEPTIIFLAPTKDPSKATEKHSKKMGMVIRIVIEKRWCCCYGIGTARPFFLSYIVPLLLVQEHFLILFDTNAMILFLSYIYY